MYRSARVPSTRVCNRAPSNNRCRACGLHPGDSLCTTVVRGNSKAAGSGPAGAAMMVLTLSGPRLDSPLDSCKADVKIQMGQGLVLNENCSQCAKPAAPHLPKQHQSLLSNMYTRVKKEANERLDQSIEKAVVGF
eukprot:scpid91741/ scgid14635/ 